MGIEDLALEMRLQKTLAILKQLGIKRKKRRPRHYGQYYIIDVADAAYASAKLGRDARFVDYDSYYELHYARHRSHAGAVFVYTKGVERYFVLREGVDVNS